MSIQFFCKFLTKTMECTHLNFVTSWGKQDTSFLKMLLDSYYIHIHLLPVIDLASGKMQNWMVLEFIISG